MAMETRFRYLDSCIICGGQSISELMSIEQMESQKRYREQIFRQLFKPNTPDYLLKDHVFFTHTYQAQLVTCNKCGLVYRNPRLSEESAIQEYGQDTYHVEWLEASFRAYYNTFLQFMPKFSKSLGSKPRILEIGSHVGGFLAAAQTYGWDAQGVDVGQCVSDFARAKSLKVFTGMLAEAQFPTESFDAVFVWVCFDQIPNPWKELKEIHRILKKQGILVAKVPNGEFIKISQLLDRWALVPSFRTGLWKFLAYSILLAFPFQIGYTPSTLRIILEKSGFKNLKIYNQMYIPVTNPEYVSASVIQEEIRYMKFVHALCEIIYQVSAHQLIKGPWIEFICRKQEGDS
jgi:SAM-dependent methyltransferase